MSDSPRRVAVDTFFLWDGAVQRLGRGQVIDVTPGGALEKAIGRERLVSLRGMPLPPPVEPAGAVEPVERAVVQGGGGGGAADSVTVGGGGGGGGGAYEVTPVSPPVSFTVGEKQDTGKDGDA